MKVKYDSEYVRKLTCPICKEEFIPAPQHSWTAYIGGALVCSYHCFRKSEREHFKKNEKKRRSEQCTI